MNPTVAFPPATVQDCEENILEGAEMSTQLVSVGNPVPLPETTAPAGPVVGVRVRLLVGPAVTANVAVAESPAPAFV